MTSIFSVKYEERFSAERVGSEETLDGLRRDEKVWKNSCSEQNQLERGKRIALLQ